LSTILAVSTFNVIVIIFESSYKLIRGLSNSIKYNCLIMSEGRMRFFGLAEDKLYYDESKKRFVSTKDAPAYIERSFKNGHFKDVSNYF
jgi:hypothetical protein